VTELPNDPGLALAAALLGAAWVVVTLINRRCRHEWEKDGEAVLFETRDSFDRVIGREHRQPVRCSKCGTITYFKRA
jgi:hypothetical protein